MKKYLSIMLFVIAAVFVSCGDDKDEPKQPEFPTMSTEYLKGRAYQEVGEEDWYLIFTESQKMIEFKVKEEGKTLWLYHEFDFSVQEENHNYYLVYPNAKGGINKQRIWFDGTDKWQNYTFTNIVIEHDLGDYIGKYTSVHKYVGKSEEILSKFASYTKD